MTARLSARRINSGSGDSGSPRTVDGTKTMGIPASKTSHVIGPRGATVQGLEREHRVKIVIDTAHKRSDGTYAATITGRDPSRCKDAIEALLCGFTASSHAGLSTGAAHHTHRVQTASSSRARPVRPLPAPLRSPCPSVVGMPVVASSPRSSVSESAQLESPGDTGGHTSPQRYICIDHGNIVCSAANPPVGPVQVDVTLLTCLLERGAEDDDGAGDCGLVCGKHVAGIYPRVDHDIWDLYRSCGYDVLHKDNSGAEKYVHDSLHNATMNDMAEHWRTHGAAPGVLVLATGSGSLSGKTSYPELVEVVVNRGWKVELWSFRQSRNQSFSALKRSFPDSITLIDLDEYVDDIVLARPDMSSSVTEQRPSRTVLHTSRTHNRTLLDRTATTSITVPGSVSISRVSSRTPQTSRRQETSQHAASVPLPDAHSVAVILPSPTSSPTPPSQPLADPSQCCTICLDEDAPKTHVVIPCGHKIACADCSARLLQQPQRVCPICRGSMESMLRVYD